MRRWTKGATYIRQGGHHVGHWPTFLVGVGYMCCIASLPSVLWVGFTALTLLVRHQEEHPVHKNWVMSVWLSAWWEMQMICIWSSWCHCHPIISCFIKIQTDLTLLGPAQHGCPGKEVIKRWVSYVAYLAFFHLLRFFHWMLTWSPQEMSTLLRLRDAHPATHPTLSDQRRRWKTSVQEDAN